jgi:hypothetical protein
VVWLLIPALPESMLDFENVVMLATVRDQVISQKRWVCVRLQSLATSHLAARNPVLPSAETRFENTLKIRLL